MNSPEIDWGDPKPAAPAGSPAGLIAGHQRRFETDEARRRRQASIDAQLVKERRQRRRRVLGAIATVLLLAGAGGAIAADRAGLITIPWLHRSAPPPEVAEIPPAAPAPPPPPSISMEPTPAAVVPISAPTSPPVAQRLPIAPVVDQDQVRRLGDRVAHAENGVGVISRERSEKLAALAIEDQLLRGSYAPDAAHRRDDSLYAQNKRNAEQALALQAAARARQPGADLAFSNQLTLIQNVQARIANTLTNERHDVEILRSLNERLLKAAAERDRLAGEFAAAKQGAAPP